MTKSKFTSERVDTAHYQNDPGLYLIYLFHFVAYEWFCADAAGKDVLDFGCGTGHGSAQLAKVAASVIGVDVSADTVAAARAEFTAESLSFETITPVEEGPLKFDDASFDVVVSNQVIEHVPDARRYLAECFRVLRPGGVLFVVTPDRTTRLFRWQRPWNRHHLMEYTPDGLRDLASALFNDVRVDGMTGRSEIIAREIARTRMLRLLTIPFTLPGLPDIWRRSGLSALQWANQRKQRSPGVIDFGVDDVWIAPDADPCTNICMRAVR